MYMHVLLMCVFIYIYIYVYIGIYVYDNIYIYIERYIEKYIEIDRYRQHLHQVVLHDVPDDAVAVEVARTTRHADRLLQKVRADDDRT